MSFPKMSRIPGLSLTLDEQDNLIRMYNELGEHCDKLFATLEKVSGLLEKAAQAAGVEVKP